MIDPLANNLFDLPEYDATEDETFPPLPPPSSPGRDDVEGALINEEQEGNKPSQTKDSTVSTQKAVKRPLPKLDAQRLISERGLPALRHVLDNAKFKGKGHETCLKRIRLDLPILHEDFTSNEGSRGGNNGLKMSPEEELDLFSENVKEEIFSHSSTALTEEQQRRIERNRQLALERRQAKMQFNSQSQENDLSATQPNQKFKTIEDQDPDDLAEVEIQAAEAKVADMEAVDKDIQRTCAEEIK
ncbi:TIMELESS-interacting protein isoform X2 [Gopherus evgoodei]|uniref:TIMELESS-interacting protein isoform X2 n=1 Tax=Gopherus evgoodei TaxID=1825980 RepID=UPI0011CF2D7E|nr:TIMELESS-interacting protein isoform X2 [Gopherus evgoodei]